MSRTRLKLTAVLFVIFVSTIGLPANRSSRPPAFYPYALDKDNYHYDQLIVNANFHFGWRTMGEIAVGMGDYASDYERGLKGHYSTHKIKKVQMGCEWNFSKANPLIGPNLKFDVTRTYVAAG